MAWCKGAMRTAGGALLTRAQQAGVVRPDVEIADLLKLSHAISWAADDVDRTERFLSLLLDGLRPQEPAAREAGRATP